jgi:hypothetical protein
MQVDPLASEYGSKSSYNYALNNPVLFNDPMGDKVISELPDFVDWGAYMQGAPQIGPMGAGSGNSWTDSYRGVDGNAAMMSGSTFNSYYTALLVD